MVDVTFCVVRVDPLLAAPVAGPVVALKGPAAGALPVRCGPPSTKGSTAVVEVSSGTTVVLVASGHGTATVVEVWSGAPGVLDVVVWSTGTSLVLDVEVLGVDVLVVLVLESSTTVELVVASGTLGATHGSTAEFVTIAVAGPDVGPDVGPAVDVEADVTGLLAEVDAS
jgi:hypothetical protein